MMASYPSQPGGGIHPNMAHAHPMAPNPGQHMAQPMQMHPGVSGAPHVSQAGAMMGMQPGANGMGPATMGGQHMGAAMGMPGQMAAQSMAGGMPNVQAMNHMTPQQQMQQHQMAAVQQANGQLALQQQQLRARHHQMMQQQQAQVNNALSLQQGGIQMTPQQMAQLQQNSAPVHGNPGVQLPAHLQLQMQVRQQQQQMVAAQQQQQAQQQAQNQQAMAAQLAMQQVNSQQSNQGQQNPQSSQGPQANTAQMRPQSRMANLNEQTQTNPAQHAQSVQQGQQPQPQSTQQGQPQTPQPTQPTMTPQAQQAHVQRSMQLAALQKQQSMANQHRVQLQMNGSTVGGMYILRVLLFCDQLSNLKSNAPGASDGNDLSNWMSFVERHFAAEGRLVHCVDVGETKGGKSRVFEVFRPTIAQYFYKYFESGAQSLRLHTENAREMPHATMGQQLICPSTTFTVMYPNGARLEMTGSLLVLFAQGSDLIDCLHFQTTGTEEIISRTEIENVLNNHNSSPAIPTKSPKMNKKNLPKAQQKLQEQEQRLTIDQFPRTPKGTLGIASKVQQFLEISETMNLMSELMQFAQEKKMRPEPALDAWVAQHNEQTANPQINLNGVAPGARTPSMGNMQMPHNGQMGNFSSPSMAHPNIPMQPNGMNGSPHLGNHPGNLAPSMMQGHSPSPHSTNMAAPMMMPQHSQQGTNSSAASANTSPNVNNSNNKRRRSTVKMEGDDGGGADSNSNRVKPSPRIPKKQKPGQ